ncbi:sigma-54 dependent transcriptional regulator [Sorangium sp. So ce861]
MRRQRATEMQGARLAPALTIVAHPNAARAGDTHVLDPFPPGREAAISRSAPELIKPGRALGAPLADVFVSRKPFRLRSLGEGRIRLIVEEGSTEVVVGGQPCRRLDLGPADLAAGVLLELAGRVLLLLHLRDTTEEDGADTLGMVGNSAGLRSVRKAIESIVDLHVPVLIRGETGTGKELVARAIHQHSPRRAGPFVSVNLGAVPRDLAAAELFGAQRGAFTGATRDREGLFAAARGGTLFLDEVGEAPPEVQVMLLRVLETGEMTPVGSHVPVRTDARLIAATDANLEDHIRDGRFKAPLLHRLAGYVVRLPPLRERREDIGPLFYHFAREELLAIGEEHRLSPQDPYAEAWLPAPLASLLVRHAWPGNIRELRNVTRQIVIGSRGRDRLRIEPRLSAELSSGAPPLPAQPMSLASAAEPPSPRRKAADVTEEQLQNALREHAWDLKTAADALRIPRSSIYDLVDRLPNVRTAGKLTAEEIERCYRTCEGDVEAMVATLQVSRRALSRRLKEMGLTPKGK